MKKPAKHAVERVAMDARQLLTIGSDHPWWKGNGKFKVSKGCIVRVQPPAEATDEEIELLERILKHGEVGKVRVESRAQGDVTPDDEAPQTTSHTNQREVVMQMADRSRRKDELRQLLDLHMMKVGL